MKPQSSVSGISCASATCRWQLERVQVGSLGVAREALGLPAATNAGDRFDAVHHQHQLDTENAGTGERGVEERGRVRGSGEVVVARRVQRAVLAELPRDDAMWMVRCWHGASPQRFAHARQHWRESPAPPGTTMLVPRADMSMALKLKCNGRHAPR
jgi:hypothetical protein